MTITPVMPDLPHDGCWLLLPSCPAAATQVSTLSMIPDIAWIWSAIIGSSASTATNAIRAGRASRAGTRAGRIVRLVRLVRILKLYKVLATAKQMDATRRRTIVAPQDTDVVPGATPNRT